MHSNEVLFLKMIPWIKDLPHHIMMTILLMGIVFVVTAIAKKHLMTNFSIVPKKQVTLLNFFEIISESLYSFTCNMIGEQEAPKYFSMIGSLFIFIAGSNLLGLLPGFAPATDNFNTTFGLSFIVFIYYNYIGFKSHGIGYLKHFLGPVIWLAPLMLVVEIISHLFRPLSLGLRLRSNIFGDHLVLSLFNELVPVLIPVIFYGFGIFVSFMQAFVFCLMTMVYIVLSTSSEH
jgi:F-type H+-transporting ATPase subunit a